MAFPSVQGTPAQGNTAGNTSPVTITLPAGITAGEGLLVFVSIDGGHTFSIDPSSSAGWVKLAEAANGTALTGGVFWNPSALGGGADSLVIVPTTGERWTWISWRISGHDAATTPEFSSAADSTADTNPGALTPAGGAKEYLWFASRHGDDAGAGTGASAGPAGYSGFVNEPGASSAASTSVAWLQANAATEDPGAFTSIADQWVAFTLAIYPATAGAAAPTVNAGADAKRHLLSTEFSRTATEDDGGSAITAREWSVVAGPASVGAVLSTAAALAWTPNVAGLYTLRYSATNAEGTGTDEMYLSVIEALPAGALVRDTFERVESGTWGVADHGGGYYTSARTNASPTSADSGHSALSVSGGKGRVTTSAALAVNPVLYGDAAVLGDSWKNVAGSLVFAFSNLPSSGWYQLRAYARRDDSVTDGDLYYRFRLRVTDTGAVDLQIEKNVGAGVVTIATLTSIGGAGTYVAGTEWRLDWECHGEGTTTLRVRAYPEGTAAPAWQIDMTHSEAALDVAGTTGVHVEIPSTGTFPAEVTLDSFSLDTVAAEVALTPAGTGTSSATASLVSVGMLAPAASGASAAAVSLEGVIALAPTATGTSSAAVTLEGGLTTILSRSTVGVRIGRINTLQDAERALHDIERTLGMIARPTIAYPEIVTSLPSPSLGPPLVLYDTRLLRNTGVEYVSSVAGTDIEGPILGSQIADASIETAKFATSIAAPEVVDVLPSPVGGPKLLYLTTNNTLYRNNGTEYTAEVAADLIVGQLTAGQIAAGAIGADQIAAEAVNTEHLHAEAVTAAKIAALAIETNHIAASAVEADKIAANAITAPKIAANAVESVHILANAILSAHIAANQILAGHIEAGAITTDALAASAVTAAKIAALAIETGHLAASAVTAAKIAAGAIETTHLAADSVTATAIAAGAVGAEHVAAGAITTEKLAVRYTGAALNEDPATIDTTAWMHGNTSLVSTTTSPTNQAIRSDAGASAEVRSSGMIPVDASKRYRATMVAWADGANGTFYPMLDFLDSAGGHIGGPAGAYWYFGSFPVVLGSAPTRFTTTFKVGEPFNGGALLPSTVRYMRVGALLNYGGTAGYMSVADLRIEEVLPETLIEDGAITTAKLVASAVTADKIAAGAITAEKLDAGAVTADKITAGAVTADKLAAEAVTAGKIAAGAVTAGTIAADAVTADKIDVSTLSAITANLGTITAGYLQNVDGSTFFDLNATTGAVLSHPAFTLHADGTGVFAGSLNAASGTFSGTVASSSFTTTEAIFAGMVQFHDRIKLIHGTLAVGYEPGLEIWVPSGGGGDMRVGRLFGYTGGLRIVGNLDVQGSLTVYGTPVSTS